MPPKKFCASPWIELVLGIEGVSRPCCRSGSNLGDWRQSGIAEIWRGNPVKEMRQNILDGKFPDAACKFCFENNTHSNLKKLLAKPLQNFCTQLRSINSHGMMRLSNLQSLFGKIEIDLEATDVLTTYFAVLEKHDIVAKREKNYGHEILSWKLRVLGEIVEDFLKGSIFPRHVGPVRQPNLIAICNARCIHCNGNFTNQIREGILLDSGQKVPFLSEEECLETLQEVDSIVDFFMNGSEFLFYRHWKTVVKELAINNLIKIRISSNGMLLTQENVDYLLDNNCIGKLNVSLDGGTVETINKVRGRVKFEVVRENIKYFLRKSVATGKMVPVSFSFVLSSYNYKELKDIVQLAHDLSQEANSPFPHILVQPMETKGHIKYGEWLEKHHHSRIDRDELISSFTEMAETAERLGITVIVFYQYKLDDFIKKGCPLPDYQFLETCDRY